MDGGNDDDDDDGEEQGGDGEQNAVDGREGKGEEDTKNSVQALTEEQIHTGSASIRSLQCSIRNVISPELPLVDAFHHHY